MAHLFTSGTTGIPRCRYTLYSCFRVHGNSAGTLCQSSSWQDLSRDRSWKARRTVRLLRAAPDSPQERLGVHEDLGSIQRNDAAATGPLFSPSAELSLSEAIRLQLSAVARNDFPRQDHGVEVLYHFANAEGRLAGASLPSYFGHASDLYHFGHFALHFKTKSSQLLNHRGFRILHLLVHSSTAPTPDCRPPQEACSAAAGDAGAGGQAASPGLQAACWLAVAVRAPQRKPFGTGGVPGGSRREGPPAGARVGEEGAACGVTQGEEEALWGLREGEELWCMRLSAQERGPKGWCWLTDALTPAAGGRGTAA